MAFSVNFKPRGRFFWGEIQFLVWIFRCNSSPSKEFPGSSVRRRVYAMFETGVIFSPSEVVILSRWPVGDPDWQPRLLQLLNAP